MGKYGLLTLINGESAIGHLLLPVLLPCHLLFLGFSGQEVVGLALFINLS
jgi:hypothetical protein